MPSRFSRWTLLFLIAACNLAFWLGAAAATGLLASREVDLGVETLLRERQATAAIFWKNALTNVPQQFAPQTGTPSIPTSDAVGQAKTIVPTEADLGSSEAPTLAESQTPGTPEITGTADTGDPAPLMTPYVAGAAPSAADRASSALDFAGRNGTDHFGYARLPAGEAQHPKTPRPT